jgi:hypothetical protein
MAVQRLGKLARLAAVGIVLLAIVASRATTAGAGVVPRLAYFSGPGFDACSAPSVDDLKAWSTSPFRAVNIYIGGVNRGCSQPNLSAGWVKTVTEMRWSLIPTYVGLQAPSPGCKCVAMAASEAGAQGVEDAANAVSEAAALGIAPDNPIYDDMEGYKLDPTNTAAVMSFLEGWTHGLHAAGYTSGVYSSADSGIANLVARVDTTYTEPDDIWIGDWNGQDTTSDPYVPANYWNQHQRIHQYLGPHNEDFGKIIINIDTDDCDGAVVTSATLGRRLTRP